MQKGLLSVASAPILGGPQSERDKKLKSSYNNKNENVNIKDLIVPERDDDDLKDITEATDLLSCKTKIKELESQQDYLKNVIQRLSDELAKYQVKYPPTIVSATNNAEEILNSATTAVLAPWFFDSQNMNPLLVSYDQRINDLTNEMKIYKEKIENLTCDMRTITKENEELQENLKNAIEKQILKGGSDNNNTGSLLPYNIPSEEWDEIQQRVELLDRENRILLEEQKELQTEIDRLREENRKIYANGGDFTLGPINDGDRMKLLLETAKKKVNILARERDEARRELVKIKQLENEINHLHRTLSASQNRNRMLEEEIDKQKSIITELQQERSRSFQNEKSLNMRELEIGELRDKLHNALKELDEVKEDKNKIMHEVGQMEQRIVSHQQSEFDAFQKVKETMELLENTKLERDTARATIENKNLEIEHLEEKVKRMTQDYSERYKRLTTHSQEKYKETITALEDQVKQSQLDNGQLKYEVDRLSREKKNLESEMNRIIKAAETEQISSPFIINDLNQQITHLTHERDEAERISEKTRNNFKRAQQQWEQEREQLNTKYIESSKRVNSLDKEVEDLRQNNNRLSDQVTRLEHQCQTIKFEREESERTLKDSIRNLQDTTSIEIKELKKRLSHAIEENSKLDNSLQQALLKVQKEQIYWKEELRKNHEKKEKEINDLTNNLQHVIRRNQEMEGKVKLLLIKEEELLNQKKELHIKIDKLTIYLERMKREKDLLVKQIDHSKN
ncbi:hypothetical protein ABK040_009658 [Willaertia magna]